MHNTATCFGHVECTWPLLNTHISQGSRFFFTVTLVAVELAACRPSGVWKFLWWLLGFWKIRASLIEVVLWTLELLWMDKSVDVACCRTHRKRTDTVCGYNVGIWNVNLLKPNDIYIYIYIYICRTAALSSRRYILNIYSTNIHTEYFKHAA